jgi:PAS domain S-box-containing protein
MKNLLARSTPPARNSSPNSVESLQQKTLNTLIWGAAISIIIFRSILLVLGNPGRVTLYRGSTIFLMGFLIIILFERYLSYLFASTTFIVFILVALCFSDTPTQLMQGESLVFFIIPVALAGLLLRPWAGYVVASIISISISASVVFHGGGIPNIPTFFLFFLIALIIEQATSRLYRAMKLEQNKSRALKESEEKYRLLVDLLPIGILINQEGKIVMVNPSGVKMFKAASEAELVGTTPAAHLHPDFHQVVEERVRAALTEGIHASTLEEHLLCKDGSTFFAEVSGLPFKYEGKPSMMVVFTDVTERKRASEAITAQNQRIQEMSRTLLEVQEREKHLLSAELHDDLGQSLTSLKLMLELIGKTTSTKSRQAKISAARELLSELMNKVRNLSLELRPAMLDDFGLFPALRWLFDRYQSRTGISISCDFDTQSTSRYQPHIETAAFRIIQEALTNVARHASVNHATVKISDNGRLSIEVEDQGAGFDLIEISRNISACTGLSGMQERARLLGGNVDILTAPGTGTRILASIPLTGGN